MTSGGWRPGDERVAVADASTNLLAKQVMGNKSDAAVLVVDTNSSIMAYVKGLIAILGGAAIDEVVIPLGPFGPTSVANGVDSAARYAVYLVNLAGNVLIDSETTPGNYNVQRVRAGATTEITASTAATESNGVISALINFTSGSWADGDLGYIEFENITATPAGSGVTTTFPILRKYFRLTQEEDIEAALVVIDAFHDVGSADASTNVVMSDVIGNKTDAAVDTVGTVASIIAYLKGLLNSGRLVTGTLTTSSTTVPADTSRTEVNNYWDGSWIIPASGSASGQPRMIAAFANTGGVMTLDSEHPFTTAPGTVDYVIVGSSENLVPAADGTANQTMAHVVGNKADAAAVGAASSTESLMAYAKQNANAGALAFGTFTTSSTTVPADTSRAEADNFWNGAWLVADSGTQAGQPVRIASFANTGGVFTLDSEHPFTGAPGTVSYVIVGGPSGLVPAANSVANQFMEQVIGNKTDAAVVGDPEADETIVAIIKQIVNVLMGSDGIVAFPSGVAPGNGVSMAEVLRYLTELSDSAEAVGPFSYLDAGGTQVVILEAITTRRKVSVEIDLNTMAQNGTVVLNRKVDGSTFREWSTTAFLAAQTSKVLTWEFTTNQEWNLTYLESSDEGAARSIPFNVVTEVIE